MNYLEPFLDYVGFVLGRSENTVNSYRWDLTSFYDWASSVNLEVEKVEPTQIDDFFLWLRKEKQNTPRSVNRKRSALKVFYKYLVRKKIVSENPLEYVSALKEPRKLPKYLTPQEQQALIKAASNGDRGYRIVGYYSRERTYLLILLLLDCGLRIQEVCNIKVSDLNLDEGILKVRGKGDKERIAVLSDRLIKAIKEYLTRVNVIDVSGKTRPGIAARGLTMSAVAKETGIPLPTLWELTTIRRGCTGKRAHQLQSFIDEKVKSLPLQYLLFNRGGKPLNTRQAFRIVRDIGRKAGIEIHPHLLRHSFAVNLRRKGADTMLLKEALGHSSILTTQIYCGFTDGEYKAKMKELIN